MANERELINKVSKSRLCLLLLVRLYELLLSFGMYAPRAGNTQKCFAGLVDMRNQSTSDKDCLDILKGENLRERGRPSKESGNKRAEISRQETEAWQGKERAANVAGMGIQQDNKIAGDSG